MSAAALACRVGCAACCIAPSISSPIPQADGRGAAPKAAGVPCPQLTDDLRCALFGSPNRPRVCSDLQPDVAMCGVDAAIEVTRAHAMAYLSQLETLTQPMANP